MRVTQRDIARFWARVDQQPDTPERSGCWLWIGGKNAAGYGTFWCDGQNRYTHRFALVLAGHNLQDGEYGLHGVGCPKHCVRVGPEHLRPGDQSQNIKEWHDHRWLNPKQLILELA